MEKYNRGLYGMISEAFKKSKITEELLVSLAEKFYIEKTLSFDILPEISEYPCFGTVKKELKTVGVFYYRISNGGIERVISLLIPIWQDMGYEVVLFTDENPSVDDYNIPDGVKRVVLPGIGENPKKEEFASRISALNKEIEENHIDIMVYNAWLNRYFPIDALVIKSHGIPFVMHTHGMFCSGFFYGNDVFELSCNQKNCYSVCDTIVTLSETDDIWWRNLGFNTVTTVNPVIPIVRKSNNAAKENNILWIGRISSEKRPLHLLEIMKKVHDKCPDAKLTIVGKEANEKIGGEFRKYIDDNGMSGYVEQVGYQTDVNCYYERAKVFIMTSEFEGYPMTLAEAAWNGTPIVSYDIPNLEILRKNSGISVVPQEDIDSAAAKAAELLSDGELWEKQSDAVYRDIVKMYDTDPGKKWNEIFERAFADKPAKCPGYEKPASEVSELLISEALSKFIKNKIDYENKLIQDNEKCREWIEHLEKDVGELKGYAEQLEKENELIKSTFLYRVMQKLNGFLRR